MKPRIKVHRTYTKSQPPPALDEVYSKEERETILAKMRAVSAAFYAGAVQTGAHPFIEFCGLMNEYIKVCESAHQKGIDFTQANTHSGKALPMETYEAAYIGEKIGCIYGPTLSNPTLFAAFIQKLDLPFEVSVQPRKEEDDPALKVFHETKHLRAEATRAVLGDEEGFSSLSD